MSRDAALAKLARARALATQAERLRAEAEAELLSEPVEAFVVTDLDVARVRRKLARKGVGSGA